MSVCVSDLECVHSVVSIAPENPTGGDVHLNLTDSSRAEKVNELLLCLCSIIQHKHLTLREPSLALALSEIAALWLDLSAKE